MAKRGYLGHRAGSAGRQDIDAPRRGHASRGQDADTARSRYRGGLEEFVREPQVNVIVEEFVGTFGEQIRVVGQAAEPQALAYRERLTLLDVMIEVGGLTEFASGNRARVVRNENGQSREIRVRLNDLLNDGDMSQNITCARATS